MKKIVLLVAILSLFIGVAYADSIKTVTLVDGDKGRSCLDSATGALNTIDYAHHETHAGSHYFYKDTATLGENASTSYVIVTPNTTKWAHLTWTATGSAITQADLYEGPAELSGTGAQQTIFNSDRNSTNTSGLKIWDANGGVEPTGTLLYSIKSGSATNQARTPGSSERGNEIILKQNTKYMLRVTSGTASNLTNVLLEFYEHTNR